MSTEPLSVTDNNIFRDKLILEYREKNEHINEKKRDPV